MKHFVFQILDVASALGRAASSAHPAGALAHLGEPHPDRTHVRPGPMDTARRPATTRAQPPAVNAAGPACRARAAGVRR